MSIITVPLEVDLDDCCPPNICPLPEIKGFTPCYSGGLLGDGSDMRVLLVTRGAQAVLADLHPTSGYFTRLLDGTSELTMSGTISGLLADSCCDGWEDIHPWATEVIVYRDGRDAWSGPVTQGKYGYGYAEVEADDLTAWYSRRTVPALNLVNRDLTDIFMLLHDAAMQQGPIENMNVVDSPSGIITSRVYQGQLYQYTHDAIAELAKTGLDYTAYSRTILVAGEDLNQAPYITLMDEHWTTPPTIIERGNEQATVVIVKGKGIQAQAVAPKEYLDYYGVLVRVFDEPNIVDVVSAELAAETRLDMLKDPVYIETPVGAALKTSAPITLEQLIPGIVIRVDSQSTCRKVVSDFRLHKVTVDFGGAVSIDLEPLGHYTDDGTETTSSVVQ
jgi:hypothetical protein